MISVGISSEDYRLSITLREFQWSLDGPFRRVSRNLLARHNHLVNSREIIIIRKRITETLDRVSRNIYSGIRITLT